MEENIKISELLKEEIEKSEYDSKKLVIQEIYSAVEDAGFEVRE